MNEPWQWWHSARSPMNSSMPRCSAARELDLALQVAVVAGVGGDEAALEGGDRADDRRPRDRLLEARVRLAEAGVVPGVLADALEHRVLVGVGDAQLDGGGAEQRHLHLALERDERRVGPGQRRVVDDVDQRLRAARMHLTGRADRLRLAVGERQLLLMAAAARLRAVARTGACRRTAAARRRPSRRSSGCSSGRTASGSPSAAPIGTRAAPTLTPSPCTTSAARAMPASDQQSAPRGAHRSIALKTVCVAPAGDLPVPVPSAFQLTPRDAEHARALGIGRLGHAAGRARLVGRDVVAGQQRLHVDRHLLLGRVELLQADRGAVRRRALHRLRRSPGCPRSRRCRGARRTSSPSSCRSRPPGSATSILVNLRPTCHDHAHRHAVERRGRRGGVGVVERERHADASSARPRTCRAAPCPAPTRSCPRCRPRRTRRCRSRDRSASRRRRCA